MDEHQAIRVTFTCAQCGSVNELTVVHLHEATVIHCSRCSASVAALGALSRQPAAEPDPQLARA